MKQKLENIFEKMTENILSIYQCGYEKCTNGHSYGPAIRNHYMIHYVISGKGTYFVGDKEYPISAGQGFLIVPNVVTVYQADIDDPWEYYWVGINGRELKSYLSMTVLSDENLIFSYNKDNRVTEFFQYISKRSVMYEENKFILLAKLFDFFSCIFDSDKKPSENKHVSTAVDYIQKNYSYQISVSGIAKHIGVDRSHLYRLFMAEFNCSPQEFLLDTRLENACKMLDSGKYNVTETAYSCGFNGAIQFSNIFKRKYGYSPNKRISHKDSNE